MVAGQAGGVARSGWASLVVCSSLGLVRRQGGNPSEGAGRRGAWPQGGAQGSALLPDPLGASGTVLPPILLRRLSAAEGMGGFTRHTLNLPKSAGWARACSGVGEIEHLEGLGNIPVSGFLYLLPPRPAPRGGSAPVTLPATWSCF